MTDREGTADRGRPLPATVTVAPVVVAVQDGTGTVDARVDLAAAVRGTVLALGVAALGALLAALAPAFGAARAVDGSEQGGQPLAAVAAGAALLAVVVLAAWLLRAGRLAGAVGVLTGAGAIAVGLVLLDAQLFRRALDANRLELVRPVTAAELAPGPGAVVVLVGHALLVGAALVGLVALRRSGVLDDPDLLGDAAGEGPVLRRSAPGAIAGAVAAAGAVTVGLFLAPLGSADPVVLVPPVIQGPGVVLVGTALLAVAVLVSLALALVSTSVATASGVLAGIALAVLSLAAPRLFAGALDSRFQVGVGAVLTTVGALALTAAAAALVTSARRRAESVPVPAAASEAGLPGARALHLVTAVVGLLAGVAAMLVAVLPLLSTSGALVVPHVDAVRVLLVAGMVLAAVSVGMLAGFGPALRPAAGVAWAGVLLAGGAVLQAVLVATDVAGVAPASSASAAADAQLPTVGWGAGAVVTVAAMVLAVVCACVAGLAGAAERDEVDTSEGVETSRPVLVVAGLAALAAVLGLVLPLYTAPGFTAAGLTAGDPLGGGWGWDTWSLVAAAVLVVGALLAAVRARPARGLSVLGGTALVLAVRLVSWPLTAGRVAGASAGPGAVATAVALALVLAAAVLAVLRTTAPEPPRSRARVR